MAIILAFVVLLGPCFSIPLTEAQPVDLAWDLVPGVLYPCIYTTGTNASGALDTFEEEVFLRIENEPAYVSYVETWDEIPHVNVSMIDSNGIVTEPDEFEYLIQDAGLTWTGHDWFRAAIPHFGVYETTWNNVYEDLLETWVGPWGFDINVSILPDPRYEYYSLWDQTFWAIEYNFTYAGVYYEVMASYWLYPSQTPLGSNSGLIQNVTITGEDASSGNAMNFFQLICDPSAPDIWAHRFVVYPEEGGRLLVDSLNYTEGDEGYAISWRIREDYPVDYAIYDNDGLIASGPMNITHGYADDQIEFSLDGLDAGVHNLTLVVTNTVGTTDSDWALVNVTSRGWLPQFGLTEIVVIGVGSAVVLGAVALYMRRR